MVRYTPYQKSLLTGSDQEGFTYRFLDGELRLLVGTDSKKYSYWQGKNSQKLRCTALEGTSWTCVLYKDVEFWEPGLDPASNVGKPKNQQLPKQKKFVDGLLEARIKFVLEGKGDDGDGEDEDDDGKGVEKAGEKTVEDDNANAEADAEQDDGEDDEEDEEDAAAADDDEKRVENEKDENSVKKEAEHLEKDNDDQEIISDDNILPAAPSGTKRRQSESPSSPTPKRPKFMTNESTSRPASPAVNGTNDSNTPQEGNTDLKKPGLPSSDPDVTTTGAESKPSSQLANIFFNDIDVDKSVTAAPHRADSPAATAFSPKNVIPPAKTPREEVKKMKNPESLRARVSTPAPMASPTRPTIKSEPSSTIRASNRTANTNAQAGKDTTSDLTFHHSLVKTTADRIQNHVVEFVRAIAHAKKVLPAQELMLMVVAMGSKIDGLKEATADLKAAVNKKKAA